MSPVSLLPAIVATLAATFLCVVLSRKYQPLAAANRLASLDGLRGYLALFVFLHHSCVWYFYLKTGRWTLPPSRFYVHLGQSSVALFFMITGFLFYSKLLDARGGTVDWERLYIGRVLRLTPLYLFAIALMLLIVTVMSDGVLHTSVGTAALDALRWMTFTILGSPDVNRLKVADLALAEVAWTLPYEWYFYLALPAVALTLGIRPARGYLLLGMLALAGALLRFQAGILLMFAGGIIAAVLVRNRPFVQFAASGTAAIVAMVSIATAVALFPSAHRFAQFVLLAVFFAIVAGGNDLFGLLTRPAARKLGELSYSIYLLHGLILYATFVFIIGASRSSALSPLEHWAVVIGVIPALLLICQATFRFIEYPPMQRTREVEDWLKSGSAVRLTAVASWRGGNDLPSE